MTQATSTKHLTGIPVRHISTGWWVRCSCGAKLGPFATEVLANAAERIHTGHNS